MSKSGKEPEKSPSKTTGSPSTPPEAVTASAHRCRRKGGKDEQNREWIPANKRTADPKTGLTVAYTKDGKRFTATGIPVN